MSNRRSPPRRSSPRRVLSVEALEDRLAMSGIGMRPDSDRREHEFRGAKFDDRGSHDSDYGEEGFRCCESPAAPVQRPFAAFYVVSILEWIPPAQSRAPLSDRGEGESPLLGRQIERPAVMIAAPNSIVVPAPHEPLFTPQVLVVVEHRTSSLPESSPASSLAPTESRTLTRPPAASSIATDWLAAQGMLSSTGLADASAATADELTPRLGVSSPPDVFARRFATDLVLAAPRESSTSRDGTDLFVDIELLRNEPLGDEDDDPTSRVSDADRQTRIDIDSSDHSASKFGGERDPRAADAGRDATNRVRRRLFARSTDLRAASGAAGQISSTVTARSASNGMVELSHSSRSGRNGGAGMARRDRVELLRMGTACARLQMFDIGGGDSTGRTEVDAGTDGTVSPSAPLSMPVAPSSRAAGELPENVKSVSSDIPAESMASGLTWPLSFFAVAGSFLLFPGRRERILSWTAAARRTSHSCRDRFRQFLRLFRDGV